MEKDNVFYCEDDYYTLFNPKCGQVRTEPATAAPKLSEGPSTQAQASL